MMVWNLPNILTWLRILAIPAIVICFIIGRDEPAGLADPTAGLLFAAAAITDSLDGFLARRLGQITPLGAFLDPVADKLIVAVSALREWMAAIGHHAKVAVSGLGKYKTIVQMVGLSLLLYRHDLLGLPIYRLGEWLLVFAALLTLVSMIVYMRAAAPYLTQRQ